MQQRLHCTGIIYQLICCAMIRPKKTGQDRTGCAIVIPSPATSYNYHLLRVPPTPGTDGEQRKVNKQQQTALNMARFIKSQSLTLLEKLDALDADEQAAMCERLHELAEELQNSIQVRFETESETGT